jgi:hypothetical protein
MLSYFNFPRILRKVGSSELVLQKKSIQNDPNESKRIQRSTVSTLVNTTYRYLAETSRSRKEATNPIYDPN